MCDKEKGRAAKDATDLSAEYRGLYGFAHIGVWSGGQVGENPPLVGRVGRPLTSGCRAYVFWVVPLKSCSRPWCEPGDGLIDVPLASHVGPERTTGAWGRVLATWEV